MIVNSTSNNLDLNTGLISKSILKAAGPEIQEECRKYKKFKEGEIAITQGYGLNCKRVFHGAIPGYNPKEKVIRYIHLFYLFYTYIYQFQCRLKSICNFIKLYIILTIIKNMFASL